MNDSTLAKPRLVGYCSMQPVAVMTITGTLFLPPTLLSVAPAAAGIAGE